MLGVLGALLPVTVAAQDRQFVADIPFNFTIRSQQLPAGKYKVQPITSATTNLLLVRSDDGQFAEITWTRGVQSSKRASEGKLIFNRYGNQYFLAEFWFAGEMTGNEVLKSDMEEALINEFAPKRERGKVTIRVTETKPN
jgi:hypothetical protein